MSVRYVPDYAGWGQVLNSPALGVHIRGLTEQVRDSAGGVSAGFHMQVGTSAKGDRITGRVWTATHAGRVAEAEDRALTKAFGSVL